MRGLEQVTREYVVITADRVDSDRLEPLQALLQRVRTFLKLDIAFVAEFVDGQLVLRVVDAAQDGPTTVAPGMSEAPEDTYCQQAFDGRACLAMPESSALTETRNFPVKKALGIGCYLTAPVILANGVVYGTLCCFSQRPAPPLADTEVSALRAVTKLISTRSSMESCLGEVGSGPKALN